MIRRSSAAPMLSVLLLSLFAVMPAAHAASETYVFDKGHTRVEYSVVHLGFSDMPGIFYNVKGKLEFDPGKPENASVEATIDATSVTMNNGMLDSKIKGSSFFNTDKFPVITFKSTDVNRTGSGNGTVTGNLTLLGVTRPVTLNVTFSRKGWDSYAGAEAVGFTATTKIHRSDFGMKYLLPDVGDDVTIKIDVEALKAKAGDLDNVNDKAGVTKVINTGDKDTNKSDAEKGGGTVVTPAQPATTQTTTAQKPAVTTTPVMPAKPSATPPVAHPPTQTTTQKPRMGQF